MCLSPFLPLSLIYIYTYMLSCIHAYMHTCMHAYMRTCVHACMHACIHRSLYRYRYDAHILCIYILYDIHVHVYMDICMGVLIVGIDLILNVSMHIIQTSRHLDSSDRINSDVDSARQRRVCYDNYGDSPQQNQEWWFIDMGLFENNVPLNPMVNDHYPY